MKNRKKSTFVYEGLGFPITLINAPMRKMLGEWVIDIDFDKLQFAALHALLYKPASLTGDELRFIRKFLSLSTTAFGKVFGVSHVSIVKWENEQTKINPAMEVCIRLYMLNYLHAKDKEFRALYNQISLEKLSKSKKTKIVPISIDAAEELKIAL